MRCFRYTRKGQDWNPELPHSVPVLLLQDQASFAIIALVLVSGTVSLEGGKVKLARQEGEGIKSREAV